MGRASFDMSATLISTIDSCNKKYTVSTIPQPTTNQKYLNLTSNLQDLCGPCCWNQTLEWSPWTAQGSRCVLPCQWPGCNGLHPLELDGTFLVTGCGICCSPHLPAPGMPPSNDGSPEGRCRYSAGPTPSLHWSANRYAKLSDANRILSNIALKNQDVPDRCCCSQDGPGHGRCRKSVRSMFPGPQSYWAIRHTTPLNTSKTQELKDHIAFKSDVFGVPNHSSDASLPAFPI